MAPLSFSNPPPDRECGSHQGDGSSTQQKAIAVVHLWPPT
jgi:hypothetical protein